MNALGSHRCLHNKGASHVYTVVASASASGLRGIPVHRVISSSSSPSVEQRSLFWAHVSFLVQGQCQQLPLLVPPPVEVKEHGHAELCEMCTTGGEQTESGLKDRGVRTTCQPVGRDLDFGL
jgi:hypothetical protein